MCVCPQFSYLPLLAAFPPRSLQPCLFLMSLLTPQPLPNYVPLPTPQLIATSGTSAVHRCPPRSSQPSLGYTCPAAHSFTSAQLPALAACIAYVFCCVPFAACHPCFVSCPLLAACHPLFPQLSCPPLTTMRFLSCPYVLFQLPAPCSSPFALSAADPLQLAGGFGPVALVGSALPLLRRGASKRSANCASYRSTWPLRIFRVCNRHSCRGRPGGTRGKTFGACYRLQRSYLFRPQLGRPVPTLHLCLTFPACYLKWTSGSEE